MVVDPQQLNIEVVLPWMDGQEIYRCIRATNDMLIILDTARTAEVDGIIGLKSA